MKLMRKYTSFEEDRKWANKGLLCTVIDGESIPLIQSRVEDVGFKDIDIIPVGADKVFMHSLSNVNVSEIVGAAKPFFNLVFSSTSKWDEAVMPFQRSAWIHLYGIPLQAWNKNFFKLCVLECGRYLRADKCSLNREPFYYARVLISTSSLEVLNVTDQVLVDGVKVEIKIIEEWGFCLGDDACLYEEDEKCDLDIPEAAKFNDEIGNHVDILVDKMAKDVEEVEDFLQNVETENGTTHLETSMPLKAHVKSHGSSDNTNVDEQKSQLSITKVVTVNKGFAMALHAQLVSMTAAGGFTNMGDGNGCEGEVSSYDNVVGPPKKRRHRATSCSTDGGHSFRSGPWNVDWLKNVQQGDIGLISSNKKRLKKVVKGGAGSDVSGKAHVTKKRVGGVLRHLVLTL